VSGDGWVAVGSSDSRPFRWTQGSGMVPVADVTWLYDLSSDGEVMVGHDGTQAIRWTAPGSVQPLGILAGDDGSNAFLVTPDGGTVVGSSYGVAVVRLFRWTQASGIDDLGELPAGYGCDPLAVSADGSIVVGSCPDREGASFVWTAETGIVNPKDYFAQNGVDVSGVLDFDHLESVSDDGRTFVGWEESAALEEIVSWVVVIPPEPVSALAFWSATTLVSSLALAGLSTLRSR